MIQFNTSRHNEKFSDFFYQDTAIYDIIHYDDALCHSIRTNDKVLAPLSDSPDLGSEKYAPAEVLEGFEKRRSTDSTDQGRFL